MSQDWGNQQPGPGGNPPWAQPGGITPQPTPPWQQPGAGGNPPWAQPGGTPPWVPGAGGGLPPGQRPPSKKPVGLIVAAIAAVVVLGGIAAVALSGGGDDDDDERSSDTDRQSQTDDTDDTRGTDDTNGTDETDDTQGSSGDGTFVLTVDVTHPFSGDLGVVLGVFDDDDELVCSSVLVEATGQPSDIQSIDLDASDCADFYPPGPGQHWVVNVADLAEADEGTLDRVELVGPDGDEFSADDLPVVIPDADPNGVLVELT